MLKKSLIAIAVLAIVLPAVAGDKKWHKWETTYVSQELLEDDPIIVVLDVGYYIHIVNQKDIEVYQFDGVSGKSVYETYWGCNSSVIKSNFDAIVTGKATATSPAGGSWSVYFAPGASTDPWADKTDTIYVGKNTADTYFICVLGTGVKIGELEGGAENVPVAEVDFEVIPGVAPPTP
jgi:hypothetical protein